MNQLKTSPIGVFDSGVGGLTVLREINRQLPNESILYFGDTARLPYGIRSQGEILQFVREILTWMTKVGTKMVIMACNTSSALALDAVRSEFDFPILGIVLPGARAAIEKKGKRIGVIATPATAKSKAYSNAILETDPTAQVWQIGCPEFVPIIEQGRLNDPYTKEVAKEYLAPLLEQEIDTLIYGCTHYPHLEPVLRSLLPSSVQLIDPASSVVKAAEQELELLGLKNTLLTSDTKFCVSGNPQQFSQLSQCLLEYSPLVKQIHLTQAASDMMMPLEKVD